LLVLTLAGLLAGFGWLIWQPTKTPPTTHFVALLTGDIDRLSLPPILFEEQTLAPLQWLAAQGPTLQLNDDSSLQQTGDLQKIEALLGDLKLNDGDRVIVYVSAHGVSIDGEAYLLAPDYDLREPESGRCRAVDLIQAVARLPAATKLVVFDCAHLAVDPRMGMGGNEFAYLVEQAVQRVDDPGLCVMLAGAELEISPLGLADRRSVLGGALVDALLGDADLPAHGDNDRSLSLEELNGFVVQRCAKARAVAPIPRLLACGTKSTPEQLGERAILALPPTRGTKTFGEFQTSTAAPLKEGKGTTPPAEKKGETTPKAAAPPASAAKSAESGDAAKAGEGPGESPVPKGGDDSTPAPAAIPATAPAALEAPANVAKAAETDATGKEGAGGAAVAATPSAPPPPLEAPDNAPEIIRAWRMRDRLQSDAASQPRPPLPADYAPQYWNAINKTLETLHLERIGRPQGDLRDTNETAQLIEQYRSGLEQLANGGADATHNNGLLLELLQARRNYEASKNFAELQNLDEQYIRGTLDLRRHLVRANQFVQWHAALQGTLGDDGPTADAGREIEQFLEALAELDRTLEKVESAKFASWSDAGPQLMLRQLDSNRDKVLELARQLDSHTQLDIADIQSSHDASSQRRLEAFLATSLATAKQREALVDALATVEQHTGISAAPNRPAEAGSLPTSGSPRWASVLNHLRLEVLLVQLADPAMQSSEQLNAVLAVRSSAGGDADQQRHLVRDAARELSNFYANIPDRTRQLRQNAASVKDLRTAQRIVALMHPRDASRESADIAATSAGFIAPQLTPPAEIVLNAPPTTKLRKGVWTPVEWTLQLRNVEARPITATITEFDSEDLQVRFLGDKEPARVGAPRSIPVGAQPRITLEVLARNELSSADKARTKRIRLQVQAGTGGDALRADRSADVMIPRPNHVTLLAETVDPRRRQIEGNAAAIELKPFPNRSTTFEISLENRSDEDKDVRVELFAVPQPLGQFGNLIAGGWPPGRLRDVNGRIPSELEAWANRHLNDLTVIASGTIHLPADENSHLVPLKPPGADAPKDEATAPAAEGGAAAPPAEPKAPTSIDVTHGLICRIIDEVHPDVVWMKWIEIVPLRPSSYVHIEGRVDQREIQFTARPAVAEDRAQFPPGIAGKDAKPVEFVIRGDGTLFPSASLVSDSFDLAKPQAQLTVQPMERAGDRPTVSIDVDGVPRAAAWRVEFENQRLVPVRNPASVRIERIGMAGRDKTAPRMYRMAPSLDYPTIDEKQWPTVVNLGGNEAGDDDRVCAFDVSHGVRPLQVLLRVDAAADNFNSVGGGNAVVLRWEKDAQPPYRIYDDRDIHSQIVNFTANGGLNIATSVADFSLSLPSPSLNDKAVKLTAELSVQEQSSAEIDALVIVFDGQPPQIEGVRTPPRIRTGAVNLPLSFDVVDSSGVASVEIWFTPERMRTLEQLAAAPGTPLALPDPGPFRPNSDDPRSLLLQAKPPEKAGKYYVTLRVTDHSGQSSDTLDEEHILIVEDPKPPVVGPVIGDLRGQVMVGTKFADPGITVTAKGDSAISAQTESQGRFTIKRLEAGTYTLIVDGKVASRPVKGELEVKLTKKEDYDKKYTIMAAVEWAEPPPKK
jgi:hypothetical protein